MPSPESPANRITTESRDSRRGDVLLADIRSEPSAPPFSKPGCSPCLVHGGLRSEESGEPMRQATLGTAGAIAFTVLMAGGASGQTLNIWPGVAPGSEQWTQQEKVIENTPLGTVVFNVGTPTPTVFLPHRTKTTGTGLIIAPGGAFVALAIDHEGYTAARRLHQKRIAAFVLKYRTVEKHRSLI